MARSSAQRGPPPPAGAGRLVRSTARATVSSSEPPSAASAPGRRPCGEPAEHQKSRAGQHSRCQRDQQPPFCLVDQQDRGGQQVAALGGGEPGRRTEPADEHRGQPDDDQQQNRRPAQPDAQQAAPTVPIPVAQPRVAEEGQPLAQRPGRDGRHHEQRYRVDTGQHRRGDRIAQRRQPEQVLCNTRRHPGAPRIRLRGRLGRVAGHPPVQVFCEGEHVRETEADPDRLVLLNPSASRLAAISSESTALAHNDSKRSHSSASCSSVTGSASVGKI